MPDRNGPQGGPPSPRFALTRADVLLLAALFAVGLLVRLPWLMLVPRFQDEGLEALWGLEIAAGRSLPLTGSDPYYGPLFSYVVAFCFWVFGPVLAVPRMLAAVAGALTVAATYWLGLLTVGRRAALWAAVFALSSRSLVTVSSHYGWSNSLSPVFAVAAIAAAATAHARQQSSWLVVAGALAGFTAQTHPITATVGLGLGAWMLLASGVRQRFSPWAMAGAMLAAVVAYAPMLWSTVSSGLSVSAVGATRAYAFVPAGSPVEYGARAGVFAATLWSSTLAGWPPFSGLPVAGPGAVTTVGGVVLMAYVAMTATSGPLPRRAVALVVAVSALALPAVLQVFLTRYVSYLLPLVYVLAGDLIGRAVAAVSSTSAAAAATPAARRRGSVAEGLGLLALALVPLGTLGAYYQTLGAMAGTNQPFFELREELRTRGACNGIVLVEEVDPTSVGRERNVAYYNREAIRYVLSLDGCPMEVRGADFLSRRPATPDPVWMVLTQRTARRLTGQLALTKVLDMANPSATSPEIRLGLYTRAAITQ